MGEITINEKFLPLKESDARYYIVTGGRGSSKSFSTTLIEATNTLHQGYNCLYTRYTMTSAELSIIPEFKEKIEVLKEDRKDERVDKQASKQSKLISQRKGERGNRIYSDIKEEV